MRGRKLFYDKSSGEIFLELGEGKTLNQTTIEQDIAIFTALSERNQDTFDVIQLEYGQLVQDFNESISYHVDVEKLVTLSENDRWQAIVFDYPDPNNPSEPITPPQPLSVQITDLQAKLQSTQDAVDFLIMGGI